jgi:hypothetical protein
MSCGSFAHCVQNEYLSKDKEIVNHLSPNVSYTLWWNSKNSTRYAKAMILSKHNAKHDKKLDFNPDDLNSAPGQFNYRVMAAQSRWLGYDDCVYGLEAVGSAVFFKYIDGIRVDANESDIKAIEYLTRPFDKSCKGTMSYVLYLIFGD